MKRAVLISLAIFAAASVFCTLAGAIFFGSDGAGLGAIVGFALGMTIAARYLHDAMAVAAARRDPASALAAAGEDRRLDRLRLRRSWHSLRSPWGIDRLLRQNEQDRRAQAKHPTVKRLYSQRHHDLDIRDIPGAAHLARKRKPKR